MNETVGPMSLGEASTPLEKVEVWLRGQLLLHWKWLRGQGRFRKPRGVLCMGGCIQVVLLGGKPVSILSM